MSPLRKEALGINQAIALRNLANAITNGWGDDRKECPACLMPICDSRLTVAIQNKGHEHRGKVVCQQCAAPKIGMEVKGTMVVKQAIAI